MFPHDPTKFIQLLDPGDFIPSQENADPGFTQLVHDTLGNDGTDQDGFDAVFSETAGLVDAWDQALAEQDTALDAVLTSLAATDPGALDNSMAGYASSFDAGNAIVTAGQALKPPELLVLPLSTSPAQGIPLPPVQNSQDFGTLRLGDAPQTFEIGRATQIGNEYSGVSNVMLANGDGAIFSIVSDERDTASGNQHFLFTLVVTPAAVGQFTGQVEYNNFGNAGLVILTITVNVIP